MKLNSDLIHQDDGVTVRQSWTAADAAAGVVSRRRLRIANKTPRGIGQHQEGPDVPRVPLSSRFCDAWSDPYDEGRALEDETRRRSRGRV